jgi:RNA polymerase II-associated factor 1
MQETTFHFVRDYETVKVEQEVPNEFLLVLYEGDGEDSLVSDPTKPRKERGAYYKNIERKMHLKKKRVNVSVDAILCQDLNAKKRISFLGLRSI